MKKNVKLATAIMLAIMLSLTTYIVTYLWARDNFNSRLELAFEVQDEYSELTELIAYIDEYYIGEYDKDEALETALWGYALGVGDEWSGYLTPEQHEVNQIESSGELVGIGVNVIYDEARNGMYISNVFENSPAEEAGLEITDIIVAVEGERIEDIGYDAALVNVIGEEGEPVNLTVLKGDEEVELSITRERIVREIVTYEMLEDNIGYVFISDFDETADVAFIDAVNTLVDEGAESFIFDVRNNPGGYVTVVANCLDILLPEGTIITQENKEGEVTDEYFSDEEALGLEMVVLVNSYSISGAEFFAAALRDYDLATIVGQKTDGKGYSQQTFPLSGGGALVLSTEKYFTPSGENLAGVGIVPDVEIDISDEDLKRFYMLEKHEDEQLQGAIDVLS